MDWYVWYFLFVLFVESEFVMCVGAWDNKGLVPNHYGIVFFSVLFHATLLVLSVIYCGWIYGFVCFALYFFNIFHATITWILSLHALLIKSEAGFQKYSTCVGNIIATVFVPTNLAFIAFSLFHHVWMPLNVAVYIKGFLLIGIVMFARNYSAPQPHPIDLRDAGNRF